MTLQFGDYNAGFARVTTNGGYYVIRHPSVCSKKRYNAAFFDNIEGRLWTGKGYDTESAALAACQAHFDKAGGRNE